LHKHRKFQPLSLSQGFNVNRLTLSDSNSKRGFCSVARERAGNTRRKGGERRAQRESLVDRPKNLALIALHNSITMAEDDWADFEVLTLFSSPFCSSATEDVTTAWKMKSR
jgi:hypothetical protein